MFPPKKPGWLRGHLSLLPRWQWVAETPGVSRGGGCGSYPTAGSFWSCLLGSGWGMAFPPPRVVELWVRQDPWVPWEKAAHTARGVKGMVIWVCMPKSLFFSHIHRSQCCNNIAFIFPRGFFH